MRIEESVVVEASRERVWAWVGDPSTYRRFVSGLTRWEAVGEQQTGTGARYAMRMRVGAAEVGGLIEVVEFEQPGDIAWTSITGLDQRGRWRLRERGEGRTDVMLRFTYQAPGGIVSTISDRFSGPLVRRNLRRSLEELKRQLEGAGPAADGADLPAPLEALGRGIHAARVLAATRVARPERPDKLVRLGLALARWGPTPAGGYTASAIRHPHAPAVIDERGELSFEQIHRRTNSLAHALSDAGVLEGDGIAIMCRNHRGFIEATIAASKLGAHSLYLNTAFAGPQLTDVVKREKPAAIVYDHEFADLLADAGTRRKRFVAWHEPDDDTADPTLDELIDAYEPAEVVPPGHPGKAVILTSGTTGTPKGASRGSPGLVGPGVALLSRIPLRARETTMIAAPLFHSWGYAHFMLGMALGSTYVLRRRFDPEATLAEIDRHRATTLPVVPVMLQRILELPEETRRRYDTSSLRVVAVSGSALPGELANRFMDEFGEVIYNLYGSTEVAWATIATPRDLREAPGTSGSPPRGTTLKILGEDGSELPRGDTGRIFVRNDMLFEGYTGGGSKDVIDGLMATGDVGHLDEAGRLLVEGRDDEMIVSGGENVFPREVEDLLADLDGVGEVAIIGVEDERFGQRLKAFVAKRPKAKLSANDVKAHVKAHLAGFKVPRDVEFIDELPRNATGKVLKRDLA